MATKKKDALALWDQELADAAAESAKEVASLGGGQFISTKGGVFKMGDNVIGHEMPVIVVASMFENVCYDSAYDPDNRQPPVCYAFGKDLDALKPHENVTSPVCDSCKMCDNNQWGSAATGRGKACSNRVRLAVVSAGEYTKHGFEAHDADGLAAQDLALLGLPPTSVGTWAAYVKNLASMKRRPPYGVFTLLEVQPDDKRMLAVKATFLDLVNASYLGAIKAKQAEAKTILDAPYPEGEEKPKGRRGGKKKASKKKAKKKSSRKFR